MYFIMTSIYTPSNGFTYKDSTKISFIVILLTAYGLNEDVPEYDMDVEDEKWLEGFNKKKVKSQNI